MIFDTNFAEIYLSEPDPFRDVFSRPRPVLIDALTSPNRLHKPQIGDSGEYGAKGARPGGNQNRKHPT